MQRELRAHTYRPGRSVCFVTEGQKPREVFAAGFLPRYGLRPTRDARICRRGSRVARSAYRGDACRKGKGVLAASDRLAEFLRQITANGRRPAWALKLDVASFFPSIHKQTLYEIIARWVRDPKLRWLTETILFHDPTADYRFKGGPRGVPAPDAPDYPIPDQKSLFGTDNERGLPIGNLTSQFWANVYLNGLDQFLKRELKCRFYVRYVDDLVLLHDDPDALRHWREEIRGFLAARLKLRLREPDVEVQSVGRGIAFVGSKTFWNHRVARRQTLANCATRLRRFERREMRPMWNGAAWRVDMRGKGDARSSVEQLHASLASYSGHLRHGGAWGDWEHMWQRHAWLHAICQRTGWSIDLRWPTRDLRGPRFSVQYGRLIRRAGQRTLVFCQVGRFIEFYGPQREVAAQVLRLVRVGMGRGGHAFSVGVPVSLRAAYLRRAVRAGWVVADVCEVGRVEPRCAERRVVAIWLPAGVPNTAANATKFTHIRRVNALLGLFVPSLVTPLELLEADDEN